MSVTLIKQPFYICPAHNDIEFYASSDQTGQPNFNYYVVVTVNGSDIYNYRIPPDPGGNCYYNACGIARKYVDNYYPFGVQDFINLNSQFPNITVNIGEEYGSTPTIHSGTDFPFWTWNASLQRKERALYDPVNYLSYSVGQILFMNNYSDVVNVKLFQDLVFYFVQSDFIVDHVYLNVYDSSNALINEFMIMNSINVFPSFISVNLGPEPLNAFSIANPGAFISLMTSSLPVITAAAHHYDLIFSDTLDNLQRTVRVNIISPCQNRFIDYSLLYLNRLGGFDFTPMQGNDKNVLNIEKTFYKGLSNSFEGSYVTTSGTVNTNGLNPIPANKRALNISYDKNLTLQSQPYIQDQIDAMSDMFTSAKVFVNEGFADYTQYSQEDISYEIKKNLVEKIVTITANLKGNTERRQFE